MKSTSSRRPQTTQSADGGFPQVVGVGVLFRDEAFLQSHGRSKDDPSLRVRQYTPVLEHRTLPSIVPGLSQAVVQVRIQPGHSERGHPEPFSADLGDGFFDVPAPQPNVPGSDRNVRRVGRVLRVMGVLTVALGYPAK